MREGWEIKKLGDVCYSKSSNVSQNQLADEVGIYQIFGASGLIKSVSFYHRDKPYLSIVKDGSGFGRVTKMEAFTSVIGTLQYILPNDDIDLDYLNYSLMSVDFKKYVQGAAIPHIYFKDYKNEPFLWMPLPEQQRIVAILDEAFATIAKAKANAEQNIKKAKELFESYLRMVFNEGSIHTTIGEQVLLQRGFDITKDQQQNGDIPVVSSGGIKSFHNKAMVQSPGVVIGRKGTLGKVFYLENDFWPHDTTLWIKDFKGNNPKFVYYFFMSLDVKSLDSGAANPALNRNQVHPIKIRWSSIILQPSIVQKLDALSLETKKLEAIYQKKIEDLEELKKSILQKAFSGELKTEKILAHVSR